MKNPGWRLSKLLGPIDTELAVVGVILKTHKALKSSFVPPAGSKNLKILHSSKWCLTSWMKRLLKNSILKVLTLVLMNKLCFDMVLLDPLGFPWGFFTVYT